MPSIKLDSDGCPQLVFYLSELETIFRVGFSAFCFSSDFWFDFVFDSDSFRYQFVYEETPAIFVFQVKYKNGGLPTLNVEPW